MNVSAGGKPEHKIEDGAESTPNIPRSEQILGAVKSAMKDNGGDPETGERARPSAAPAAEEAPGESFQDADTILAEIGAAEGLQSELDQLGQAAVQSGAGDAWERVKEFLAKAWGNLKDEMREGVIPANPDGAGVDMRAGGSQAAGESIGLPGETSGERIRDAYSARIDK